jgi:hypothetical protein
MTAEKEMEEKKSTRRNFLKTTACAESVAGAATLNAVSPAIWPKSWHQVRCSPEQGVIPRN